MKRLIILAFAIVCAIAPLAAHGDNEHVRGVVTQVSAESVTVETAPKTSKTLTLTAKTAYKRAGKAAHLADLKIGDRVVIDVPVKTTTASLIQIGTAAPAAAAASHK